jgi:hypothetical protein
MRIISVLLLGLLFVSAASAELLVTANPLGQGKWAVLGAAFQDSNVMNNSSYTALSVGGYAGYGITDKLDAYLQLGQATLSGLPAGVSASTMGYGLSLKYGILDEAAAPVSVSVGAGYKLLTSKMTGLADGSGNQLLVGIGVSKVMAPFVPYGGVAYRSTSAGFAGGVGDSTQLDVTIGSAIAWSTQGAVFVEYTLQSMTPSTASGIANHSSGQIALGVGYVI